jgi:hypothetical protein
MQSTNISCITCPFINFSKNLYQNVVRLIFYSLPIQNTTKAKLGRPYESRWCPLLHPTMILPIWPNHKWQPMFSTFSIPVGQDTGQKRHQAVSHMEVNCFAVTYERKARNFFRDNGSTVLYDEMPFPNVNEF